jgi:hypothetical protein
VQRSVVVGAHVMHAPPAVPHAAVERTSHTVPLQQLLGQLVESLAQYFSADPDCRPTNDNRGNMRTLGRRYPNRGTGRKSHGMV